MTSEDLKLLLRDAEVAQRQLNTLVDRLRQAIGPGRPTPEDDDSFGHPRWRRPVGPPEARDHKSHPDDAALAELACPTCAEAMRWIFSKKNGEWFAGCTTYGTSGCRGSRSYESVFRAEAKSGAKPGASSVCSACGSTDHLFGDKRCKARTEPHLGMWGTVNFGDRQPLGEPPEWVREADQAFTRAFEGMADPDPFNGKFDPDDDPAGDHD